jgi:2-aminoadipate transaminase
MLAHEVARGGFMDLHVRRLREVYGRRCNLMLTCLERAFPRASGVRWTRPQGGLFLWLILPGTLDADRLLPEALAQKVAFVPGSAFHPLGGGGNTMRLNFSNATDAMIEEGIARLGRVVTQHLEEAAPAAAGSV